MRELALAPALSLALAPALAFALAIASALAFALTLALVFALTLALAFALTPALAPDPCCKLGFKGRDDFGRIGPNVFCLLLLNGGRDYKTPIPH